MKCQKDIKINNSVFLKCRLRMAHAIFWFFRKKRFKGSREIGKICKWFAKCLIKPKSAGPAITPTLYGFDIIVDPSFDRGLELQLFQKGTYEPGTLEVMRKCLSKGDVFIDIGSNIGLMSLFASKAVTGTGKVLAFEPEPETFRILKENIRINGFGNILANNIALGYVEGTAKIHCVAENRGGSTLLELENSDVGGKKISIGTLDKFLADQAISSVRMIKIDVEGWELEVLKGSNATLSSPNAPIICIECSNLHPTYGGQKKDIYTAIRDVNNYKIFKLRLGKDRLSYLIEINNEDDLPDHDNLFCFLREHMENLDTSLFSQGNI